MFWLFSVWHDLSCGCNFSFSFSAAAMLLLLSNVDSTDLQSCVLWFLQSSRGVSDESCQGKLVIVMLPCYFCVHGLQCRASLLMNFWDYDPNFLLKISEPLVFHFRLHFVTAAQSQNGPLWINNDLNIWTQWAYDFERNKLHFLKPFGGCFVCAYPSSVSVNI
jgi:hypothetical protein